MATALFVFTNERGFSHEIPAAEWDIALALAAFLALLLLASRDRLPSWTLRAAYASIALVDGLAAFRIGGAIGAVIVIAAIVFVPMRARRLRLPSLALLASLAANYPLLRALADPRHPSPLPSLEAFVAVVVPVLALPFVLGDPDRRLLRWGFWLTGTGMLSLLTERYFIRVAGVIAPDDVLLTAGGAVLVIASAFVRSERWTRVAAASGIGALALVALLMLQGASYVSDSPVAIDQAARDVLRGEDPYVSVDIVQAIRSRGLSDDLFTKYADRSGFEHRFAYPAGSFLPSTALFALGARDVRYGFLALLVALYVVVAVRAPARLAPYVSGVALANVMAVRQVAFAGVEPSWALFLALAFPLVGGVFGGLAAAARQTAWLYLPFVALDRARSGIGGLVRWGAIVAGVFLLVNLPFALRAPGPWLEGSTAPLVAPYEPLGFGVIRFSTDGGVPLAPRAVYTLALLVGYALALWTYWRHRASWRYGLAVLPVAPLYLAWRSLQNYFMFAPLFLLSLIGEDPSWRDHDM